MNYLWQSYAENKKYYLTNTPLPDYEVEFEDKEESGLNPLGRFFNIFKDWLNENNLDDKTRREIENSLIHVLAHFDFDRGVHRTTVAESIIEEEIIHRYYGDDIKDSYKRLSLTEQNTILHFLRRQMENQNKKSYFYEAVLKIFPGSKLYYYKYENKFLLYLPYIESENNKEKVQLLLDLFFDIRCDIEIFWNKHFGIIGHDVTMHMDKMIIY